MLKHTIPLVSGRWTAEIAPDRGANPIRVQFGGADILIPWTAEAENPFLIGSPLLLPANRTAGGRFSFRGTEYTLPISDSFHCANLHGSLYLQRFQVTEQSPSCVGLHLENQGEIFPFAFVIRVRYHIEDSSFVSEYVIENPADTPMPFTFALHTTFRTQAGFRSRWQHVRKRTAVTSRQDDTFLSRRASAAAASVPARPVFPSPAISARRAIRPESVPTSGITSRASTTGSCITAVAQVAFCALSRSSAQ